MLTISLIHECLGIIIFDLTLTNYGKFETDFADKSSEAGKLEEIHLFIEAITAPSQCIIA